MKKLISVFVLICLCSLTLSVMAQQPGPGMQQRQGVGLLEGMKIAFITKRLNLTPEEAQRFWPVYYPYAAELRQAHLAYRQHMNELRLDEDLLNIKKRYSSEFARVLPPEKVNQFFRAEKDFGAFVQKEMQRRQLRRPMPVGPVE
jgi:hypothetical protein